MGFIIGIFVGMFSVAFSKKFFIAQYDRHGVDKVMKELIGDKGFESIISDELLVVSYDYNQQEPRFFSKWFERWDSGHYNFTLGNATAASAAAPTYFDPKILLDNFGFNQTLVDGGVICNNPALNAFTLANLLHGHQNIRVLSLGTGELPFTKLDHPEQMTKLDFL